MSFQEKVMGMVNPELKAEIARNRQQLERVNEKYNEMLDCLNQQTEALLAIARKLQLNVDIPKKYLEVEKWVKNYYQKSC